MADLALIYRRSSTVIETIELDASLTETHTKSAEVTDHPVERGPNVVDHVRRKPDGLVIEGMISDTPLSSGQVKRYNDVGLQTTSLEESPRNAPGNAVEGWRRLSALFGLGTVFTVVTGLETYTEMVLTDLTSTENAQSGDALRFSATFKQVRIVENKLTVVDTRVPGGKKRQKVKPATPAEATPKQKESVLSKITGLGEVGESF